MTTAADLTGTVERRSGAAGSLLYDAIRLDFARFVARQVEDRLRARPRFVGGLGVEATRRLRIAWFDGVDELVEAAGEPVLELRSYLEEQPKDEQLEAEALTIGLGRVLVPATAALLRAFGFPGDAQPEGAPPATSDEEFRLAYTASAEVLWAWRDVRAFDRLKQWLAGPRSEPPLPPYRLALLLPEAPTLDLGGAS